MNIAIITAAGKGTRMKLGFPKQYYAVEGKPLIAYTISSFQNSPKIDGICLVVSPDYKKRIDKIVADYSFSKVRWIAFGGETNQLSIANGLKKIEKDVSDDDIVLIHDGIRPLVTESIIEDSISVCSKYGNAVAVIPCNEAILFSEDFLTSTKKIDRQKVAKTQTPHSMRFKDVDSLMKRTIQKGVISSVAICTMLIDDGQTVHFSKGSNINFKLTQPEDIGIFKGLLYSLKQAHDRSIEKK
jgi:2-C-methyl-D-erythritol 4-phosphate cytidylyltransferase